MVWIGLSLLLLGIGIAFWLCLRRLAQIRRGIKGFNEVVQCILDLQKDSFDPELARLDTEVRKIHEKLTGLDRRLGMNDTAIGKAQQRIRELDEKFDLADVLTSGEDDDGD